MADVQHFDIAVIGAGIAGSALASALGGNDLAIALVEAQSLALPPLPAERDLQHFDPRVSAITPRSRLLLEQLGAWDRIAAYRQCAYRHMTVWDAEGTGAIEFDCADVNAVALGHIVENRAIVSALLARVAASADITVFSGAPLQDCQRDQAVRGTRDISAAGGWRAHLSER